MDLYGELITVKSKLKLSRDKNDDFLINLAVDGHADYLITGDNDLLSLVSIHKTKIVRYSDFIKDVI